MHSGLLAVVICLLFCINVECYQSSRLGKHVQNPVRVKTMSLNWALHDKAQAGDLAAVMDIIDKDPKLCSKIDIDGQICLHFAAKFGYVDMAKYLIEKGPGYVNFKNIRWRTPLHWATSYAGYDDHEGCEEVAYLLVKAGGNINAENKDLRSPLWYAKQSPLGKKFADKLVELSRGVEVRPVDIGIDRVFWG